MAPCDLFLFRNTMAVLYRQIPVTSNSKFNPNFELEENKVKKIKLSLEYPWYSGDEYIEVTDEVADAFLSFARGEKAQKEKIRYHRAFYSLDVGDGIEGAVVFVSASPQEIYERKITQEQIYFAINQLPEKQARRIYARFFQDMTISQIAKIENIDESAVRHSVNRGLKQIEKILKNFDLPVRN